MFWKPGNTGQRHLSKLKMKLLDNLIIPLLNIYQRSTNSGSFLCLWQHYLQQLRFGNNLKEHRGPFYDQQECYYELPDVSFCINVFSDPLGLNPDVEILSHLVILVSLLERLTQNGGPHLSFPPVSSEGSVFSAPYQHLSSIHMEISMSWWLMLLFLW